MKAGAYYKRRRAFVLIVAMSELIYLKAYSASLQQQALNLLQQGQLGAVVARKYPQSHDIATDKALYAYIAELKADYMRNSPPINKVLYDSKINLVRNALGLHTAVSRVQGGKLKAKAEIRIASLFKDAPAAFLNMIVVHELAHLKERQHDKAFYQLCSRMEPDYHQLEFDVRVWLCWQEAGGRALWAAGQMP